MPSSYVELSDYYDKGATEANFGKRDLASKNLIDISLIQEGKGLTNAGAIVTQANYSIVPAIVAASTEYTYSGTIASASNIKVRFENSSGGFLGVYNANASNFILLPATFTTPAGCTKLYITSKAGGASTYNTIQLEIGASATTYVSFGNKISSEVIDLSHVYLKTETDALFIKPVLASKNLLNKGLILEGKGLSNTGAIVNQANYSICPVAVSPLTEYTYSGVMGNPSFVKMRFENSLAGFLGVYNANAINFATLPATFTTPSDCTKLYVTTRAGSTYDYDTSQLELGSVATPFTAFGNKLDPTLIDISKYIDPSDMIKRSIYLPWLNKRVIFFGDSITQQNRWQASVQAKHGFTYINNGVAGSCIATGKEDVEPDAVHRTALVTRAPDVTALAGDLILIFAGTNDWYYGVPIGAITDVVTTTFYGALKALLTNLQANNVAKTIVMCTPLQRGGAREDGTPSQSGGSRVNYSTQKLYRDATLDVAGMFAVQVLDLFTMSGMTYENLDQYTDDDVHPNSGVGAPALAKKISSFLFRI
jgi:lysophospholipase L1-like esterase